MAQGAGAHVRGRLPAGLSRCAAGLLASALVVLSTRAGAVESDIQLWPVLTMSHEFDEQWAVHLQTRLRLDDDVTRSKDFLWRPLVSWRPRESLELNLGYDYLDSFRSASEHRIWQAVEHRLPWGNLLVKNRIRLGQRFVDGVDGAVVRFRYRLRGVHPIGGSGWYAAVSNEFFANLNNQGSGPDTGFEQNRLRLALGRRFSKYLNVESGYEWQYAERRNGPATNRHVFLLELSIQTREERRRFPFSPF